MNRIYTTALILLCFMGRLLGANNTEDDTAKFYQAIQPTPQGINRYLENVYNDPRYTTEILPNNFDHMLQLLIHGKQTNQSRAFARSVLRLYLNGMKRSSYINAYAFYELMEKLPELLEDYFMIYKFDRFSHAQKQINKLLYGTFSSPEKFSFFQQKPEQFLDQLSQQLAEISTTAPTLDDDISIEELRRVIMTFLEVALNKLVWSPQDGEDSWLCVKGISNQLAELLERNIFDDTEDLNDLFISLIERYCYFLDITSTDTKIEFYEKVRQDIADNPVILFELEEQEEAITPKSDRLLGTLIRGQAQASAREHGIVV